MSDLIPGQGCEKNDNPEKKYIFIGNHPIEKSARVLCRSGEVLTYGTHQLSPCPLPDWAPEWVRPPAPEGVSWVRLSDTVITDVRRYAIGETTAADSSEICNLHRVAKELRLLNPEPAPEVTAGMWVHLIGDDCFIERIVDGKPVIWFKRPDGWRCESYKLDEGETFKQCDPPSNAGELYELLGVTGDPT